MSAVFHGPLLLGRWLRSSFLCLPVVWPLGCGRPATLEDCEKIIERVTVLELKAANISDPKEVDEYVAKTKNTFREAALTRCVGKRISQEVLDCIALATSADQVLEDCFD
jgi:hypothetical protein